MGLIVASKGLVQYAVHCDQRMWCSARAELLSTSCPSAMHIYIPAAGLTGAPAGFLCVYCHVCNGSHSDWGALLRELRTMTLDTAGVTWLQTLTSFCRGFVRSQPRFD